jgi:hypothetical protein
MLLSSLLDVSRKLNLLRGIASHMHGYAHDARANAEVRVEQSSNWRSPFFLT